MATTHSQLDHAAVRDCLHHRDFRTLFREHLGWDNDGGELTVEAAGVQFTLTAVAQKRGFRILHCPQIPERNTRVKIDNKITAAAYEHLIIFTDGNEQIWQWTRREPGRPAASRSFTIAPGQSGEALIQKLMAISFSLDEEDSITIAAVAGRARAAFDVEKVTKRFYTQFTAEHEALLKFITGVAEAADLQWYGSLMLNRLMFVYFIQKKGFLDNDVHYLRNRLNLLQQQRGKGKFHSFYRYFLLRLFHDGLGTAPTQRDSEMEKLLGNVPYLNGGFFEVHHLEQKYPDIDIPDEAFQKLFDFFDRYRWHLDERPCRAENEINPDVVGYIFEKYINQKQMGAYYTKEDITEYISKNTLIPFLYDAAREQCPIAFKPGSFLWRLLQDDPDRYIYPAVRKGVIHADGTVVPEQELPDYVQTGMKDPNARMFDKRYNLSQSEKDDPIRLPTETWREYVARRTRCLEIRAKLQAGEIHEINDLITLNLDIWQFARDAISKSEGPELLRAFWTAIREITVLDPTCGSGAFLFAALRILETLYEDCLGRMEGFVSELAPPKEPEKFTDFRAVLAQMAQHPSEAYFVLKSIIINNLFGVDIMPEAVEICKLRLFLKLAAQAQTFEQIEPLPDIDFNIRSGNTLVGYATLESLKKGQEGKLLFSAGELADIERSAIGAARIFTQFKEMQTQAATGSEIISKTKTAMRQALAKLADRLDRYLAGEYGIDVENKPTEFEKWKSSHQPFHWLTEFYGVMSHGGFDVIIGNPPYVNIRQTTYDLGPMHFKAFPTGDLFPIVTERALQLARRKGAVGIIVPLSATSTERMRPLKELLATKTYALWASYYSASDQPASLFSGVRHRLCVLLGRHDSAPYCELRTTRFLKWFSDERTALFQSQIQYATAPSVGFGAFPKVSSEVEQRLLRKLAVAETLGAVATTIGHRVYYHNAPVHWGKAFDFVPMYRVNGGEPTRSSHLKEMCFPSEELAAFALCLLSSSLFYWFNWNFSNCRDLSSADIARAPAGSGTSGTSGKSCFIGNAQALMEDYRKKRKVYKRMVDGVATEFDSFYPAMSKPLLDRIDQALAEHYGLTPEELDFIINYDIKYRMGAENGAEAGE
ncbi:MAG: Eco57I restriction-modification methylase domain-containing protein [Phycisphaerae bacterium]